MKGWLFVLLVGGASLYYFFFRSDSQPVAPTGAETATELPMAEEYPSLEQAAPMEPAAAATLPEAAPVSAGTGRDQDRVKLEQLTQATTADPEAARGLLAAMIADPQLAPAVRGEIVALVPRVAKDERERRQLLSRALTSGPFTGEDEAYRQLEELNRVLIFSRNSPYAERMRYVVQPGDSLWLIMKRLQKERPGLKLTTEFLQRTNELSTVVIKPGMALSIPHEPMRIHVSKARFLLDLYLGDVLLKRYPVCLGKDQKTPAGKFVISSRIKEPPWIQPGRGVLPYGHPDNVLGTRWLGFQRSEQADGLGIHGTWQPDSIGKNLSEGCVRLRNEDVEVLFDLVPEGTPVVID